MDEDQILDSNFSEAGSDTTPIEPLSEQKFILLFLVTFGLYGVWWMFKVWRFFKEKDRLDIMPAARAIFAIIFFYPLMEKIKSFATKNGQEASYSSGLLFAGLIFIGILSQLPGIFGFASLVGFAFYLPGLRSFNATLLNSGDFPLADTSKMSQRQMILLVIFGILWALTIIGLLVPEDPGF